MPSVVVTANTVLQPIAAERENAVVLAKSLTIDNQVGPVDCEITIRDTFTPSNYYGAPTPIPAVPTPRFRAIVVAGDIITLGEEDLKGVKCLGAMGIISNVIKPTCDITVGYEHE